MNNIIFKTKCAMTPYQLEKMYVIIRAIGCDKNLKKWFESLKGLPCNLRTNAIMQITTDMRRNQEDMDIISALCTLCDTDIYNTAVEALNNGENEL